MTEHRTPDQGQAKDRQLQTFRARPEGTDLTTDQGVKIPHTDDSLNAGERGPTLMEDFHFREKITHFDHERIPERVVHARGSGAHGYFQVYESLAEYTRASFLQDPSVQTPVFVRFSQVLGDRGSADTVRDVRGFATKFYTDEGVYDLVGNNIPVFFIQDAIKFPDLIHAARPEPHNEIPQAATAHDTFWDFISLMPESTHMVMWVLSDRGIPRSYRMMEGFGVHTFRFVNAEGNARFVKFHWKPKLGVHSLVWDEAQILAGKDPDFLRRDLWEAIQQGDYPEWELGIQLLDEADEFKYPFDVLDATKIWPEELVPVRRVGRLVLNRNPDNFFAETEQVAFHIGNLVPGIDVTNDPLLQGRLFSYLDTQLIRLGGPNFHEIPINKSVAPVRNNQRDGYHRTQIDQGRTSYFPNTLGAGYPRLAPPEEAYVNYPGHVEGDKVRRRSERFRDYFSQATLFWNSLSASERRHLLDAARFELGRVETPLIRQRMVALFDQVDRDLAVGIAEAHRGGAAFRARGCKSRRRRCGDASGRAAAARRRVGRRVGRPEPAQHAARFGRESARGHAGRPGFRCPATARYPERTQRRRCASGRNLVDAQQCRGSGWEPGTGRQDVAGCGLGAVRRRLRARRPRQCRCAAGDGRGAALPERSVSARQGDRADR